MQIHQKEFCHRVPILLLFTLLSITIVYGCASVKNEDKDEKSIGFEHYAPKFYLVQEVKKDGSSSIKVLTLPDISKPRYVKYNAGWGSVDFNFKIVNGILTEFGQSSTAGGPEAVTALAALGTAYGGILTGVAAQITAEAVSAEVNMADPAKRVVVKLHLDVLDRAVKRLRRNVVAPLDTFSARLRRTVPASRDILPKQPLFIYISKTVESHLKQIEDNLTIDVTPNTQILEELAKRQALTKKIIASLDLIEKSLNAFLEKVTDPEQRGVAITVVSALSEEIKNLRKFAFPPSKISMWEIVPVRDDSLKIETIGFKKIELE